MTLRRPLVRVGGATRQLPPGDTLPKAALPALTAADVGAVARTGPSGAALIPGGTEAQRPAAPEPGMFRYNSETNQFEGYQNGQWGAVGGGDAVLTPGWALSRASIGDGYAAQDGQLLSRATYPDAWAQAQAIGMVITDAEWLADPLKRGFFSSGNGSTTFRLPDANGKQAGSLGAVVLRGDGALSAGQAGLIQPDAMQPITGSLDFRGDSYGVVAAAGSVTGAFKRGAAKTSISNGGSSASNDLEFDSSLVVRTASETRPLNLTVVWTIKLFGAVVNVGSADAAQLASDYANLAAALQTFESRYDSEVDFIIIYPNGGGAVSPANVSNNTRYVEDNPFPGYYVICRLEVFWNSQWVIPGLETIGGASSRGADANQLGSGDIVVQTCANTDAFRLSSYQGAPHGLTSSVVSWPLPARVLVWKVKGAIA